MLTGSVAGGGGQADHTSTRLPGNQGVLATFQNTGGVMVGGAGGGPIKTNIALPLFFLPCSGYYFKPGPHSAAAEANLDF